MTRRAVLLVVFVAVAAGAAFLSWRAAGPDAEAPPASLPAEAPPPGAPVAVRTVPLGEAQLPPSRAEAEAALAAYHAELSFGEEVRAFVEAAGGMTRAQRREAAEALTARVVAREADGVLAPVQSRALRLAIDAATYADDPDELRRRADALAAEKAAAEPSPPDPRLAAYKAREAEIVAEVMAMSSYPGGLSRGDYLRQRLDEVRAEVWGPAAEE